MKIMATKNGNLTMNILLAPSIPTDEFKLQSLLEVVTLNDIACKPANTEIGQGDVIIE